MRLFATKLRSRILNEIDAKQRELAGLEAKKHLLNPAEYAMIWSKQKDLIDDIRLLKSILS